VTANMHADDEDRLRDPGQVLSLSAAAIPWDERSIEVRASTHFWDLLSELDVTLLVTREYEHLVLALSAVGGRQSVSCLRVPHPSGLTVDRDRGEVYVACTRNPNQVLVLAPTTGWLSRGPLEESADPGAAGLVPTSTRFLPGCLYLHDLAMVRGRLLANAVGLNAVVDLADGGVRTVWWPRTIESPAGPDFTMNLLQVNSIAAGDTLETSFFTASTEHASEHPPGDPRWRVDRQGVIFSGSTGEVAVRGLTRPHSARFGPDMRLWVDDSGYGTLNVVEGSASTPVVQLPGWTRGLSVIGRYAIVGTSRVISRFRSYAPGLDVDSSSCGLHIVDTRSGIVEASISWPSGNQIFAIDWLPTSVATSFVGGDPHATSASVRSAWFRYRPPGSRVEIDTLEFDRYG